MGRFPQNDIMSLTEAQPTYDLAESVGPDLRLGDLLSEVEAAALLEQPLAYGPTAGRPELRQALAELHGVAPEEVVVTAGGMQTLFLAAFILCEPGAQAVTTRPLFPNALSSLQAVGAAVRELPLGFEQGYRLDPADLAALLGPETRLVSLATPQNPSGVAIPRETLRALLDVMAVRCPRAVLLVDETYRDAVYSDAEPVASAVDLDPRVLVTGSLSKCHGAPGLRIGWAVTRDPGLREQLILGKFNSVICTPVVEEALALAVLRRRESIIGERRHHLREALARTEAWVGRESDLVEWVRPDAGALCCIRLRPTRFDPAAVERFGAACGRHSVRLGEGGWFGEPSGVFRLGFGLLPLPDFEAGLQALSAALHEALREAA